MPEGLFAPYAHSTGRGIGLAKLPRDVRCGGWVAGKPRTVPAIWIQMISPQGITHLGQPPPPAVVGLGLRCPLESPQPTPRVRAEPSRHQPGVPAAVGLDLPPELHLPSRGEPGSSTEPSPRQVQMCTHSPGTTPNFGYPGFVALYLCCLAGSYAWEEAEPSRSCRAEGWPDPQTSDVAFSAAQSLGIARSQGFGGS